MEKLKRVGVILSHPTYTTIFLAHSVHYYKLGGFGIVILSVGHDSIFGRLLIVTLLPGSLVGVLFLYIYLNQLLNCNGFSAV
jgi:hypothetical protein